MPARNEERCLGACLQSVTQQNGVAFEVIVVDDGSSDRTREIAESFAGVQVVAADPLPTGWSGKSNAITSGLIHARGRWLLLTDADTVHLPGSLARALEEAKAHDAAMLSYSPAQEVRGFWESAVMPVVFAELATTYKPKEVSDPTSPAAAANGQYILIEGDAYRAVGGHSAIAQEILEDVALARAVKRSGRRVFFRYGDDAVRTRMYCGFREMREGWTKNLALLFQNPGRLAASRAAEFAIAAGALMTAVIAAGLRSWTVAALATAITVPT